MAFPASECTCVNNAHCGDRSDSFYCSLEQRHAGQHRACYGTGGNESNHMICSDWGEVELTDCEFCENAESICGEEGIDEVSVCTREAGHTDKQHIYCDKAQDLHQYSIWIEEESMRAKTESTRQRLAAIKVTVVSGRKLPIEYTPSARKIALELGAENVNFVALEDHSPMYAVTGISNKNNKFLNIWAQFPSSYQTGKRYDKLGFYTFASNNFDAYDLYDDVGFLGIIFKVKTPTAEFGGCWNLVLAMRAKSINQNRTELRKALAEIKVWKKDPEAYRTTLKAKADAVARAKIADDLQKAISVEYKKKKSGITTNISNAEYSLLNLRNSIAAQEADLKVINTRKDEFEKSFSEDGLIRQIKPIFKMVDSAVYNAGSHTLDVMLNGMWMTGEFVGVIHKYNLGDLVVHIPMNSRELTHITITGGVRTPSHPHMLPSGMCWGEHQTQVAEMRKDMAWAELIAFIKTFLQAPNVLETYGMTAQRWPEIEDGEYPIHLPERECCAFDAQNYCKDADPGGYLCTRKKKHAGNHSYCRGENYHNFHTWKRKKEVPATTITAGAATTATNTRAAHACDCVGTGLGACGNLNPVARFICTRPFEHDGEHVGCTSQAYLGVFGSSHRVQHWANEEDMPL